MAKTKTVFLCQECGYSSAKWLGKCPDCGQWNTFAEERESIAPSPKTAKLTNFSAPVQLLDEVQTATVNRWKTGINEFDRILGGGVVPGSLTLVGGPPGIGKSTILLQVFSKLSQQGTVLYVSGEESAEQVKSRAIRLGVLNGKNRNKNFYMLSETNLENVLDTINQTKSQFVVIDSIQTIFNPVLNTAPGSVGQVRECTAEFVNLAKTTGTVIFLLGHVTKDGALAGPRILEHLVDTVLYFETEKHQIYRILRAYKNRFGPTNEIGVFEMKSNGLAEVSNPSAIFLEERSTNTSGNVVVVTVEGTRPLLLEIQALVTATNFPAARRMVAGLDYNRIILLAAVLDKRLGYHLENQDIFVNVVGGVKIKETAVDLGIACAIASGLLDFTCPADTVLIGEVGLGGEIRSVDLVIERIKEAERLGFKRCIVPKHNLKNVKEKFGSEIVGITKLDEAIELLRGRR